MMSATARMLSRAYWSYCMSPRTATHESSSRLRAASPGSQKHLHDMESVRSVRLKVRIVEPDLVERVSLPNTSPAHTTLLSDSPIDAMAIGTSVNSLPLMAPGSGCRPLRLGRLAADPSSGCCRHPCAAPALVGGCGCRR
ncbi:MAG: hypothetical protein BWY85_02056 [Firmicutes bacterium ADurb.Bin506]|nr:MAG: hypothetical protein BWY85_02056 [Firmicutes bacterium ADurb.Bin506]